ncbi:autotransporter domain-containing protein, partial [Pantoea ananatis]
MLTDLGRQQGASVINRGILKFSQQNNSAWSGSLTGSGQLTKDGSGTLTLGGTLNQSQVNLDDGSLVMDGLQAVTNIIAKAATTLSLVNGATLTGSIDPTDVNIDGGSTWNITGDSQVNNLTNAGNVVFAPPSGAFAPHTLTVSNFTGSGGTLTLNTVAGDSGSPTDKVVIDGGRATGNTNLNVLNHGGLGAQTAGSGIPVIQSIDGATTDAGAFSMSNPLVAGAYEYSLYRNADESWYLTTQKTSGGGTSGDGTSGGSAVPSGEVNYRAAMWSYAAMPSLSMDYDRLVAGEADTRFRYAPDSRVWGRLAAGQLRHPDSGSLTGGSVPESSSAYSFFQLGGDLWQLDGANADWRAGIYGATGVMRSDVWRDSGTASAGTDRDTVYTGGAYLSGRSHSGLHIDGLLQASRHSLKAASEDGTRLSTHGTGWLASAEVGQAFTLTPSLALEPQLQYTVQGLSLGDAQDDAASLSWS